MSYSRLFYPVFLSIILENVVPLSIRNVYRNDITADELQMFHHDSSAFCSDSVFVCGGSQKIRSFLLFRA